MACLHMAAQGGAGSDQGEEVGSPARYITVWRLQVFYSGVDASFFFSRRCWHAKKPSRCLRYCLGRWGWMLIELFCLLTSNIKLSLTLCIGSYRAPDMALPFRLGCIGDGICDSCLQYTA
jgi:hypothetical protein